MIMMRDREAGELFSGTGDLGCAERAFYDLLIKNKKATLEDVRNKLYPNRSDEKVTYDSAYRKIVTARHNVIAALSKRGGIVNEIKTGTAKTWVYEGKDLLKDERVVVDTKIIRKLVEMFEASSDMIPFSISAHFLQNTNLVWSLRDNVTGNKIIYGDGNPKLKGLDLIPELYEHIVKQHVLQFKYHPFGKKPYSPIIHPHVLKLYNDRWFLLGYSKKKDSEEYNISNIALDRIESRLYVKTDVAYKPCGKGMYERFFEGRIGVSGKETDTPDEIVIRAHSSYAYGLITTKPLHHTQTIVHEYDENIGYGEISIRAVWNDELCGNIMRYGKLFEIVSPSEIRTAMKEKLTEALGQYVHCSCH